MLNKKKYIASDNLEIYIYKDDENKVSSVKYKKKYSMYTGILFLIGFFLFMIEFNIHSKALNNEHILIIGWKMDFESIIGISLILISLIYNYFNPKWETISIEQENENNILIWHHFKKNNLLLKDIVDVYIENSPVRSCVFIMTRKERVTLATSLSRDNAKFLVWAIKNIVNNNGSISCSSE